MAGRNEPCPCGSGVKHKRCCLKRADLIAAHVRERDALFDDVIDWVRDQHPNVVVAAGEHTRLVRLFGGPAGRSMSAHWALGDYRADDETPTLLERYAEREELGARLRSIGRALAAARLDVYRVVTQTGTLLVFEALRDGTHIELHGERHLEALAPGELLVTRIATTESGPATLGMARRHAPDCERRWRARLATLPAEPCAASLAVLQFIAEDAAEPLPDDVDLHTATLVVDDVELALDDLASDDAFEDLGHALPEGYAFGWANDGADVCDLGGLADFELRESARVVVSDHSATVVSACATALATVVAHVQTLEAFADSGLPLAA